jgi:PKD repeat protein
MAVRKTMTLWQVVAIVDTEANADQQLKVHLDPDNTGLKVLDGYYPDGIVPDANFYTDLTEVCSGEPIQFYDASAFDVDNYLWTFSPSSVSFSDGTDETSMSPVVSFLDNTDYTVALQVQNVYGSDIQQKNRLYKEWKFYFPKNNGIGRYRKLPG